MKTQKIVTSLILVAFLATGISVAQAETPALDKMVAPQKPTLMPKPYENPSVMVPKDRPMPTSASGVMPVKGGISHPFGQLPEVAEANRARVQAMIESHKTEITERQDALKAKLIEHRDQLAERFGEKKAGEIVQVRENVAEQFGEVLLKLRSAEEKLDNLLSMLEERGMDTASNRAVFETASSDIAAAETAIANLQNIAASDTDGAATVKEAGARARTAVEKAKQSTLAAFTAIRTLISAEASVKTNTEATASN